MEVVENIEVGASTVAVSKILDPQFDLKDLLIFDTNELKGKTNEYLQSLARDNAQLIINQVFKEAGLETKVVKDSVIVDLPDKRSDEMFILPREKPLPKKQALSKWEAFAHVKGINAKKKKSRMVWCEVTNSWKPRWGYMRASMAETMNKNGESKDWVREIKPHEDPNEDPWEKEKHEKKERVAKNEHARLKNIARNSRGLSGAKKEEDKSELRDSFRKAKFSTASLGNFDKQVAGEKKERIGGKRKYNALFSDEANAEQKQILDLMTAKNPKLNKNSAADKVIARSTDMKMKTGKNSKKGNKLQKSKKGRPTGTKTQNRRQK